MSPELEELLRKARERGPLTPAERWDQRVSWTYGNLAIENPNITREMVEAEAIRTYGPRPEDPR